MRRTERRRKEDIQQNCKQKEKENDKLAATISSDKETHR